MRKHEVKTIIDYDPPLEFCDATLWANLNDKKCYYPDLRLKSWVSDDLKTTIPFLPKTKVKVRLINNNYYTLEVANV